ncbi:MAG: hypothetical protein H7X95_09155 [Deltaproteobacteria bacterium]|nr:hypothetical protein [Deltaproteobacteria bacterium]
MPARTLFHHLRAGVTLPLAKLLEMLRADVAFVRTHRRAIARASLLYHLGSSLTLSRPTGWLQRSHRAYTKVLRQLNVSAGTAARPAEGDLPVAAHLMLRQSRRPLWRLLLATAAIISLVGAILALGTFAVAGISTRARHWLAPIDLARSARWSTSSVLPGTPAAGSTSAAAEPFFFHTNTEDHPWIRFDLPRPADVKRVRIRARTDCCTERTIPMNVEVPDGDGWRLLCQRRVPFSSWSCDTGGVRTSVVRIRLAAQNMLHLSSVQIFE